MVWRAARFYDAFMDIATLGRYSSFIEKAVGAVAIEPDDRIIDLGAGTGRNACLMLRRLSPAGALTGVDISEAMISRFRKKCARFPNAGIVKAGIDGPLPFREEFDKAFISFVLHGFPQDVRETIIDNAFKALKKRGELYILDWNEFDIQAIPLNQRVLFRIIECPNAFDFIRRDWKRILAEHAFGGFQERYYFRGLVRMLKAEKNFEPARSPGESIVTAGG
jgi:demethylmenaquinone methyltransferase/2-methoxy-6-polyprenyl-1,4-benzoquinol methylase